MNHSIIVAVSIVCGSSVGSALAGPALLDYPGPGYREQVEILSPKPERKVEAVEIRSAWPTFEKPKVQGLSPADADFMKSFTKPIRLFERSKPEPAKVDLPELKSK